jgi:predicted TPR repeat methyltransferase
MTDQTDDPEAQLPSELSLTEALNLAVNLHRAGHITDAETLYTRILEIDPDQPDALNFLGVVNLHRGRIDTAIELIEKSIAIDPGRADRYSNLGNVLLAAERVDDAAEAYRKAIELAPEHAAAHNNLGIIFKAQRRFEEAERAYTRALELDPKHVETHNNYGNLLSSQGRVREAIVSYSRAITLRPHDASARTMLAFAHCALGENDKAAKIYSQWLEDEPDHPGVLHLLAACSGKGVPERASDAYIEQTFDSFSKSFDSKLAILEYRAPQLVADALVRAGATPDKQLIGLDAGCGTGLCGPLIAPYVSRLTGVDLSSGMLDKARARAAYDELVKAELTAFLHERQDEFDLVISADTLVYFGVLTAAFEGAFRALRAGGLFIFTVEKADEADAPDGHRLNPHGRYSHTRSYVERALTAAGFNELAVELDVLRMERAEPVNGLVVTARKDG